MSDERKVLLPCLKGGLKKASNANTKQKAPPRARGVTVCANVTTTVGTLQLSEPGRARSTTMSSKDSPRHMCTATKLGSAPGKKKRGTSIIATQGISEADAAASTNYEVLGHFGCTAVIAELMRVPVNVQEVKRLANLRPGSINLANDDGQAAMHYATQVADSKWTQSELAQLFLKKEACIYLPDSTRRTPIDCAMQEGKKSTRFHAVSDAVRAYQLAAEGRMQYVNSFEATLSDDGFHTFSKVFHGKDGVTPLIYSGSVKGLRIYDVSGGQTRVVQHYVGLDATRFRTAVERANKVGAKQELLFADSGGIFRFRACKKKKVVKVQQEQRVSALECDLDPIVGSIFAARKRSSVLPRRVVVSDDDNNDDDDDDGGGCVDDEQTVLSPTERRSRARVWKGNVAAQAPYQGALPNDVAGFRMDVVVEHNTPFLASYTAAEPCCDIYPMYWGPSVATLRKHDPANNRFEFRILTILPTSENKFFQCAHMLADRSWVGDNCHIAKRLIQGTPVALEQVGNGDYVCLSDTHGAERVTVFSPTLGNAFYCLKLASAARPVGISSRTVRDVSITDGEVPQVTISTTQSIEVHLLTITKLELSELENHSSANGVLPNGRFSSKLVYHILNSCSGGQYSCALSSTGPMLVVMRAGVCSLDFCLCNTLTNKFFHVCRSDALRELGERCLNEVTMSLSSDGRYIMRRNPSSGVTAVLKMQTLEELVSSDPKKRINMTFAPTSYVPMSAEMLSVDPPCGQVTLVFTDVQNSTQIWEHEPASMQIALEMHNRLLRRIMLRFCGYEVKTEGDAFMVAFHHTIDALNWCLVSQILLLLLKWPQPILDMVKIVGTDYDPLSLTQEERNNDEEEEEDIRETVMGIGVW